MKNDFFFEKQNKYSTILTPPPPMSDLDLD